MNLQPKVQSGIVPVSITNGGTASGYLIDTKGYDHCHVVVHTSAADAVTNKPSVLKLMEGDTTDATNHSNISGAVGGTDFTIPNAQTTVTRPYAMFSFSTKARRRYIGVVASPVTTQIISATAILTKGEQAPDSATEAGVGVLVEF